MDWLVEKRLVDSDGNGGFHIRAGLASETWMEYEVCNLILLDDGEGPEDGLKFVNGSGSGSTLNIDKADLFITGDVKWDGCSHTNFAPERNGYIHACSRDEMMRLGELFKTIYDIALELMPDNGEFLS